MTRGDTRFRDAAVSCVSCAFCLLAGYGKIGSVATLDRLSMGHYLEVVAMVLTGGFLVREWAMPMVIGTWLFAGVWNAISRAQVSDSVGPIAVAVIGLVFYLRYRMRASE